MATLRALWTRTRGRVFGSDAVSALVLLTPGLIVLTVFILLPIVLTFPLAFMQYDAMNGDFALNGFDNVQRLVDDTRFWHVLGNSVIITVGAVALNNALGLGLAIALTARLSPRLRSFLRASYFLPVMATASAVALVWRFLLTESGGVVNYYLSTIGADPVPWLSHPVWAKVSVILFDVWKSVGFLTLIYLAGLQAIPASLYEVADIEGASKARIITRVTIPLLSPTILFALVISTAGAFQIFDNAFVLTGGGPGDASRTMVMYIYHIAFERIEPAYASTVSVVMLVLLALLTAAQMRFSRRWVHYQ